MRRDIWRHVGSNRDEIGYVDIEVRRKGGRCELRKKRSGEVINQHEITEAYYERVISEGLPCQNG